MLVPLLGVAVFLLLIAEGVLAAMGKSAVSSVDRQVSHHEQQATVDAADTKVPGSKDVPALDLPALRSQFQAVRDADLVVDKKINTWNDGGRPFTIVLTEMSKCFHLADTYNRSATYYPSSQLDGLPQQINLQDLSTDCGRRSLSQIVSTA